MLGIDLFHNKAQAPTVDPEPEPVPVNHAERFRLEYEAETAARADCCEHCRLGPVRSVEERLAIWQSRQPKDYGWTPAEKAERLELRALVAAADAEVERIRGLGPRTGATYRDRFGSVATVPPNPQEIHAHDARVAAAEARWRQVNDRLNQLNQRVAGRQMNAANAAIAERDAEINRQREAAGQLPLDYGAEVITIRGDAREIAARFRRG